jgi:hypothetical protein
LPCGDRAFAHRVALAREAQDGGGRNARELTPMGAKREFASNGDGFNRPQAKAGGMQIS